MVAGFNDPAVLSGAEQRLQHHRPVARRSATPLLDAGIIAPAQSRHPGLPSATVAATHATPVMYYTHSISGAPNTCQPAMTYWATGLSN